MDPRKNRVDQWIYSKMYRSGSKKKTYWINELKEKCTGVAQRKRHKWISEKKTRSMINEFTAVASYTVVMMSQWNEMENIGCY